jgi:hypothetical protein
MGTIVSFSTALYGASVLSSSVGEGEADQVGVGVEAGLSVSVASCFTAEGDRVVPVVAWLGCSDGDSVALVVGRSVVSWLLLGAIAAGPCVGAPVRVLADGDVKTGASDVGKPVLTPATGPLVLVTVDVGDAVPATGTPVG